MRKLGKLDFDERWELDELTGCWNWTEEATLGSGGARPAFGGSSQAHGGYAHRWIYIHEYGSIHPGMEIAHLCHNRMCVNPAHLVMMTPAQNEAMERLMTCGSCGSLALKFQMAKNDYGRKNPNCDCANGRCSTCRAMKELI